MSSKDLNEGFEFWDSVGKSFIDYSEAPSTRIYLEDELLALKDSFRLTPGKNFLKLDLWNEALNTNLLFEVSKSGVECLGLDISEGIVNRAYQKSRMQGPEIQFFHGDIFSMPFKDNSIDFLYTMGTIEHSQNMTDMVHHIHRILKPGGKALIGLPNRLDPFLRPILKEVMDWFNLYSFGTEKSLDINQLRRLFSENRFRIIKSGSILFMPGILRIADLFLFKYCRPLTAITRVLLQPTPAPVWHPTSEQSGRTTSGAHGAVLIPERNR